jgi:flagellin FlaB
MVLNKGKMIARYGRKLVHEEEGITGLETAIVLIAFVVVAAVFAFTVLTTGLFTSEKAKETAMAGVAATSSTLAVKGSLTAMGGSGAGAGGNGCCDRVDHIRVKITAATDVNDVPFDPAQVLVTYQDDANVALMTFDPGAAPSAAAGNVPDDTCVNPTTANRWYLAIRNNGSVMNTLEPGEVGEMYLCTSNLTPVLGTNSQFRIELIPQEGAPIALQRRTPLSLNTVMNLD